MKSRDLENRIERLYGHLDWRGFGGVLHVAAIASPSNQVLALGPRAPKSAVDRFVLGLARARADAIVTTGAILRAEPDLEHVYSDDPDENRALGEWRASVLNRSAPPALVILSGSGIFPIEHAAVRTAEAGFVWSSEEGQERLAGTSLALPVVVPLVSQPADARAAIQCARERLRAETLLIEAGPSTAAELYSPIGPAVDELLLSHFEGTLDPAAKGPPFVTPAKIEARFGVPRSQVRIEEPSGFWRFERWRSEGVASSSASGAPEK